MKGLSYLLIGFIILAAACCAISNNNSSSNSSSSKVTTGSSSSQVTLSFLGVQGTSFTNADSANFRFIGINLDPWRFIVQSGEVYSKSDFDLWLNEGKSLIGVKAVRMHINGGAFEPAIGNYSESAFRQLDELLASARDNGLYVIIALRDYLWSPWPASAYDPYWYLGGGNVSIPNKDAILTNQTAKAYFKNFIQYVLFRTNSLNQVVYKDDPVIMAWEVINEPNVIDGVFSNWLIEMGNFIHSNDTKHLLTVGIGGAEGSWWHSGNSDWSELNVPQMDFIDLHYYADAGLYNPVDTQNTLEIQDRASAVLSIGKPVVFGEFGCINTNSDLTINNLYKTILSNSVIAGGSGGFPYSWGPPGPNGWGGEGGFCIFTNRPAVFNGLKNLLN